MSLDHPQKELLIAFGQGKLAAEESSSVEQHLEVCPACCETLLDLKDDTFVGLVRMATPESRMGTLARPEPGPDNTETDNTQTDKSAHPANRKGHDSEHAATILVSPSDPVVHDELPVELRDHPRYHIVELIGRGGMGSVYRAEHRLMNRPVAIKLINSQLIRHPQAVERFRREVRAAAKLTHPNIVTAYDAEQAGDIHFLVMEFVEGTDLASVVNQRGRMAVSEACDCIRQAAEGLQHAHDKGMVHRDIKPHNLMLSGEGQVRILDFGLAGFVTESALESSPVAPRQESQASSDLESKDQLSDTNPTAMDDRLSPRGARELPLHLTMAGSVMGTPDYIAPEQAKDAHSADIRADIYSLGCTLHFLLNGKPPFEADNVIDKLKAHAQSIPESLTKLRRDVPPELSQVVTRMLAKNPAERYQTPAAVTEALTPFVKPVASPPRRRVRTMVAALCMGVVALLAGVIFVQTSKGRVEIQSEVDDVEIVIKQGGEQIDFLDTKTGSQVKWLPSGEYEIKLKGDRNDVEIKGGNFSLSRWGTSIVTLKRKPEGLAADQPLKSNVDAQKSASHKLSAGWGDFINTDGASDVRESDGRVTITVPAGDRSYWSKQGPGSVPRLIQEVDGDFVAQVKVTLGRDSDKSNLFSASLAVWNHDRDFHAMTLTLYASNDNLSAMRFLDGPRGVTSSGTSGKSRIAHLKIERRNTELSTSWSRDGETWEKTKEPVTVNWPRKVQVGVAVNNRSTDELRVQFEELTITKHAPPRAIAPFDAEQAKVHQAAWAKHLGVPVEYTNSIGMKFRLIPPGEFLMGSTPAEIEEALKIAADNEFAQRCAKSEGPQHKVILSQPRYMGIYEVTQSQYEKVMGKNPSHFAATGPGKDAVVGLDTANHPVELVSWHEAVAFCAKLSQQEKQQLDNSRRGDGGTQLNGVGYRLLTEAEWEFSCRAGSTMTYSSGDGDEQLDQIAWIGRNSANRTHAVGELQPNPFGLHDLQGNVWEWCQDPWELKYYSRFQEQPALDPNGPPPNDDTVRIGRGGAFGWPSYSCRASFRSMQGPVFRIDQIGFRVSLSVEAARKAIEQSTKIAKDTSPLASLKDSATVLMYLNNPKNDTGGSVPVALLGREGRVAFRFGNWLVVFEGIVCDPKAAILGFSNFNIPLRGSSGEGTLDFGAGDKLPGVLIKYKFADEQNEISINNHRFKLHGKATRLEFSDKAYDATNSVQAILVARDGSTKLETPKKDQPAEAGASVSQNLITDPSFENTGLTQLPRDWRAWANEDSDFRCEVVNGGHTGQRSLRVSGKGIRGVVFGNDLKADRTKRYALKGWAKFEGDKDARAIIKFNYFRGSEFLGVHDLVGVTADQPGWQLLEKTDVLDAYPQADHFYVMCHVEGSGSGWFDDLELAAYDRDTLPIDFDSRHGRHNRLSGPNSLERWVGAWESPAMKMNSERTLGEYFLMSHTKAVGDAASIPEPTLAASATGRAAIDSDERLVFLTFDQNDGAFRQWSFGSNGKAFEWRGQWDDAAKTLELRMLPNSSNLMSTERFVDADHIDATVREQFVMGARNVGRWKSTRTAATAKVNVPAVKSPVAEPAEMSLLNKLAGEWTLRATFKPSVWNPQQREETLTETSVWVLGGRFLMTRAFNEKGELASIWLATYEPSEKSNRFWFFNENGSSGQWRVTWDESSRGFHWRSIDMPTGWIGTGFNRWIDDNTFDNQALIKDDQGRVLLDGTQDKRRK